MRRKTELNEEYFEVIDTEEKAYILGFIFADGNISDFNKDKHYKLRITLKESDLGILEIIKKELNFNGNIHTRKLKGAKAPDNYFINELSISSKKLILSLVDKGAVPNKTFIKTFPQLPNNLLRHFIRGYFDGNGSLYLGKSHYISELSTGSQSFMLSIVEILNRELGLSIKVGKKGNAFRINLGKQKTSVLVDFLYTDSKIHLDRKKDIANKICPSNSTVAEELDEKRAKSVKPKSKDKVIPR